jgi:hypothetical protein
MTIEKKEAKNAAYQSSEIPRVSEAREASESRHSKLN